MIKHVNSYNFPKSRFLVFNQANIKSGGQEILKFVINHSECLSWKNIRSTLDAHQLDKNKGEHWGAPREKPSHD